MVHALERAWQALRSGGTLADLRPLSLDAPLDVVSPLRIERAGMVDMRADLPDDQAAEAAIDSAVRARIFRPLETQRFDFAYYWESYGGMRQYTSERWDTAVFPSEALTKAQALKVQLGAAARFRIVLSMHLATYERPRLG